MAPTVPGTVESTVEVRLRQLQDYAFELDFGPAFPPLRGDEPPPLGGGSGPTPVQLLAAAVGNCLADSLLFALRKYGGHPEPIAAAATATVGRNADNRRRVLAIDVRLTLGAEAAVLPHVDRALQTFETFCTVTQSVAAGLPVRVEVVGPDGTRLK